MTNHRGMHAASEQLLERALRARRDFEGRGNRFLGPSLQDLDPHIAGMQHELTVLNALLEAFECQRGTLLFFEPRDPKRPIYETADIVIANEELGYLVIEVKGHRAGELEWGDGGICVPYGRGSSRTVKAVVPQAQRQLGQLKRQLENEERRSRKRGRRRQAPPGAFLVAFPRIRESDFDALPFVDGRALPRELLLFEDMLASSALRKRLRHVAKIAAEGRGWNRPITPHHIGLIDHVLGGFPESLRPQIAERSAGTIGGEISRLSESRCLTPDQRDLALRDLEGRPTLVRGVAGSGKSIILAKSLARMVERGEPVAGERPLRLLVTGFNRALIPLLRRDAEAFCAMNHVDLASADVRFLHFEGVLRSQLRDEWGLDVPSFKEMPDEERMPHVLAQLTDLFRDDPELEREHLFDHVLVDEAQDLHHESLRLLARLARVDPETGERGIAIYYDDAQNLYGKPRPRWKELGINVMGRSSVMTECRRTSRPIVTFAFNVLLGSALPDNQRAHTREFADVRALENKGLVIEVDDGIVVDFADRPGVAPEVHVFESESNEVQEIVSLVRDLLQHEQVAPSEIVIQARQWASLRIMSHALEQAGQPCHLVSEAKDVLIRQKGRVTLSTIMSAKGYDAPVAIVMAAQDFDTDAQSRAAFYVGATRAQVMLRVTASRPGPLLDEMCEIRRRLPRLDAYLR